MTGGRSSYQTAASWYSPTSLAIRFDLIRPFVQDSLALDYHSEDFHRIMIMKNAEIAATAIARMSEK